MKLKNILCIISLFIISSTLDAKISGGRPAGYQPGVNPPKQETPAVGGEKSAPYVPAKPAQVTSEFKNILNLIKAQVSSNIVKNGMIEDWLVKRINDTDLAPEQKRALFEATIELHLPLAADNADAVGQITSAMKQVDELMGEAGGKGNAKPWYDGWTRLLNEDYLQNFIKEAVARKKNKNTYEKELEALERQVKAEWDKDGMERDLRLDWSAKLNKQLAETADAIEAQLKTAPTKTIVTTPGFYNPKTNLFNQEYLDEQVEFANKKAGLNQTGAEKSLINQLMPVITNEWKKRGIAVSIAQVDAARQQIITTIANAYKPGTSETVEWYDAWTGLLNEKYLNNEVMSMLKQPENQKSTSTVLASQLISNYTTEIVPLWEAAGLNRKEYEQKLFNQVKTSFDKAMQEMKQQPIALVQLPTTSNQKPSQNETLLEIKPQAMKQEDNKLEENIAKIVNDNWLLYYKSIFTQTDSKNWDFEENIEASVAIKQLARLIKSENQSADPNYVANNLYVALLNVMKKFNIGFNNEKLANFHIYLGNIIRQSWPNL